ncbi:hypothetical protein GGTG_10141 [Gaeumannomyces tritici R3-111a-1]|uniref:DUF7603 domain-containing protein n=1 Tax=Gaeumannomyces tritici (strain R3-111a-1) TaxID=644352 RepID=J3P9G0_GAET3|nr:hypothetical protein GGTG_10141 [Gaeumannomyces tritici R3-111a-1]EJT73296.1 hypothetical protein GGTG_10141 [Gaeumannomyces tritici R3-111a-1]
MATPAPAPRAQFDAHGPHTSDTRPAAPAPPSPGRAQVQNAHQVLPSPRSSRSPSLAASISSIKRKPLSTSASAVARRYSQSSQAPRSPPSPPTQHYLDILDELPMPETFVSLAVESSWYAGETPIVDRFADTYESSSQGGLNSKALPPLPPQTDAAEPGPEGTAVAQPRNIPELNPAASQTLPALSYREHQQKPPAASGPSLNRRGGGQDSDIDLDVTPHVVRGGEGTGGGADQLSDTNSQPGTQSPNTNTVGPKIMSLFARKPSPPHLKLIPTTDSTPKPAPAASASDSTPTPKADAADNNLNPQIRSPAQKSPASSKLGTFFGWSTSSPSSTVFSDGLSPLPSPYSPRPPQFADDAPLTAATSSPPTAKPTYDIAADESPLDYCEAYLQTPPDATTPVPAPTADKIEDMEDELKAISAELAASIRREMDLEDLVDRLQAQVGGRGDTPGKRTSDYFSDSGYSSAKLSEHDANREEITQLQRRAEQEKAQVRLELSQKLQDERERRRDLDRQIQELSARAAQAGGQLAAIRGSPDDMADAASAAERVKELEGSCEDLRRRLTEERQVKSNFEDLLTALKGELESAANERDNLRDEVVPQLRARVEGLEQQASEHSNLVYESTKIQQELRNLQLENATLKTSRPVPEAEDMSMPATRPARSTSVSTAQSAFKLQQAPLGRSNTVKGTVGGARKAEGSPLSRSNTVKSTKTEGSPLSRSNTVKSIPAGPHQTESREAISERLKDVEAQRDALHNALKNLLERQEFQNRENEKKIRILEQERTRLLAASPQKAGYERDVSNLREEIAHLRKRAEEAMEQKWQVEKGLGGLKMDLDRAEEEIAGLRSLLREKDILIPAAFARQSSTLGKENDATLSTPVSSATLEKAYQDLQAAYAEALERIKKLELGTADDKTKEAMQRLERSVTARMEARSRDDDAEVQQLRERVESLEQSAQTNMEAERDLADQLQSSARRVEELAAQVQAQLATNASLRTRLAEAVTRGESNQRSSKERISSLQQRLRQLEDDLVAAQQAAEDRIARQDEELRQLREANNGQIQRLRDAAGGLRSPSQRLFPPRSPLSPMFSNGLRSPRLGLGSGSSRPTSRTGSPSGGRSSPLSPPVVARERDEDQAAQMEKLRARVAQLEGALSSADSEMQEVVGRMNAAQIEVLGLQEEREQAVRETRRLQRLLEAEQAKAFEGRFKALSSSAMA